MQICALFCDIQDGRSCAGARSPQRRLQSKLDRHSCQMFMFTLRAIPQTTMATRPPRGPPPLRADRETRARRRKHLLLQRLAGGAACACLFARWVADDAADPWLSTAPSTARELIAHRGFVREASPAEEGVVAEERAASAVGPAGTRVLIFHRGFVLDPEKAAIASTDSETTTDPALKISHAVSESTPVQTHLMQTAKSAKGNHNDTATVTIHLTMKVDNPAWSIFLGHTLQRYGSGAAHYVIDNDAACGPPPEPLRAPCLAVTRDRQCSAAAMRDFFPQCKTMTTNDEWCRWHEYDVREYYSSRLPDKAYLPLGPRLEAWRSFQELTADERGGGERRAAAAMPASRRKYAFNAIFSKETHAGREELAAVLRNQDEARDGMSAYVNIAEKRTRNIDDPRNDMLDAKSYMRVLLESAFTLAPAGHNPECFRLYEAAEAGSIPVFAVDRHYDAHPCKDALRAWVEDSPILVVDRWRDVRSEIAKLMEDPEGLDARQRRLRTWYSDYMRDTMSAFESYVLNGETVGGM